MELQSIALCTLHLQKNSQAVRAQARVSHLSRGTKPERDEPLRYNSQQILFDRELFRRDETNNLLGLGELLALHAQQFRGVTNVGVLRGHVIVHHSRDITWGNGAIKPTSL